MKIWTDKEGKKLTPGEFASRWKEGINKVTPLQQIKVSMFGYLIIVAGILVGIVSAIIYKSWWLLIILIGSFVVTGVQFLGMYQRYNLLSKIEKEVNIDEKIIVKAI